MKPLPKKIKFAGFTYKVKMTDDLDGGDSWGRTMLGKQEIYIERGLSIEKQWETLIHEMLHVALRHTTGLKEFKDEREEDVTRAWSMNIFGILKQNDII